MRRIRHLLPRLYCFSIVAKQRSFTQAAEELNISQSGVSYQIKKLEEQLGYALMIREPRRPIQLTDKGRTLLHLCEEIYANLENTLDEMSGDSLSGELSITSDVCFGSLVLAPALGFIEQRYPNLSLRMQFQDEFIELGNRNIDIAIRSLTSDPDLDYIPLCKTRMHLVASKAYLSNAGPIRKLEDLYQHKILCSGEDDFDWHNLITQVPHLDWHKLNKHCMINNLQALSQSMCAGSGIAYLAAYTVASQLMEGSIETLLENQIPDMEISYYLACRTHTANNPKTRAFCERIKDYIQQSELSAFLQTPDG
ncbi:LysR family transcriptional regulator [Neptuniibacter halophilus]|uniref:LysR family transcriptional regulator n=1 Tax=Neptuniibacter halophilus TaxID=651666 RepID=UPI002572E606|nr:LysR family transcriptional regulator [Neptuniibacter halophilus]